MWQAVIAKQEDNLYYLLKFFAESLDDDILKRETSNADLLLGAMGRKSREVREKDIPEEFKEIKDAITEENRDLMERLADAQKKKPPKNQDQQLSLKQKEINEISSQIRPLQIKQRKAKGKEAKQIKEQIEDLREKAEEKRKEYTKIISSFTRKITEDSKKIADKLEDNKNKLKEIDQKIKENKKVASQEKFDSAILNYIKKPTKANLEKYLDVIQDADAIFRYVISFDKGETFLIGRKKIDQQDAGYRAVKYSEELKEAFDAQLRGLGLGTLKPEEVLNRIKSRKEVETVNKPLNQIELVSTLFNNKDMKELKRLIADSKEILDADAQERNLKTKIELPYPKGSEFSEYFNAVLNTKVDANPRKKRLSPIRLIHDAHRGAVYRIYELLKKIYTSSNFSETKKKTAKKLMSRLETLVDERKEFKVDLKTGTSGFKDKFGKETDEARIARGKEQFDLKSRDAEYWNGFVESTIEFYSQMLEDIDLTKQQADAVKFRKDTKRRDADKSNEGEIKDKMKDFADKVARNEDFRESVSLILENFYNESSAKRFISETLFDKDKGSIYVPEIHRDKITSENKEKLLDVGMELFLELNQTVNFSEDFGRVVYYNDRINDILEGISPKKLSRKTLEERRVNNLLENPKDQKSASKYVRKYVYDNLKDLVSKERGKFAEVFSEEQRVVGEGGMSSKLKQFDKYLETLDKNIEIAEKVKNLQEKPFEEGKEGETEKLIDKLKQSVSKRPSTDFISIISNIPENTTEGKKFLRIYNNKRTQENLRALGLGGSGTKEPDLMDSDKRERAKPIEDAENKLSINEETILQVLKRKDKEKYDRYIKFSPEKLKAQLKYTSDRIKQDVKKLTGEASRKYNELDTDYDKIAFIIQREVDRRKKK
tara:strand:+ start:22 stop:2682 length:2661 start_codon:yes stop_codon:yes gene_type:complete